MVTQKSLSNGDLISRETDEVVTLPIPHQSDLNEETFA
jgi:hypothetical protein